KEMTAVSLIRSRSSAALLPGLLTFTWFPEASFIRGTKHAVEGIALASLRGTADDAIAQPHCAEAAVVREERGVGELAGAPGKVDLETAARPQAFHRAGRPGGGEGGEQVELVILALQQHLGDAGSAAE